MNQNYRFFANYHLAAKEFSNGDMATYGRLMYVLNSYGIEGVTPKDLNPVEKLFLTSVKASIDLSLTLSEAGRKKGAKKGAEKGVKYDIDKDKELELEEEKDNDKDSKNLSNLSNIISFTNNNNLSVVPSSLKKIHAYMSDNCLDVNYLDFVLHQVEKEKPEADEKLKTACFVNKSVELADKYLKEKANKPKQKKELKHPTTCPDCGGKLSRVKAAQNMYICHPCNKFYELKEGQWKWGA